MITVICLAGQIAFLRAQELSTLLHAKSII